MGSVNEKDIGSASLPRFPPSQGGKIACISTTCDLDV